MDGCVAVELGGVGGGELGEGEKGGGVCVLGFFEGYCRVGFWGFEGGGCS